MRRPLASRSHTGAGKASSNARSPRASALLSSIRSRRLINSSRSPETSRNRSTARPPTARPSASKCLPVTPVKDRRNASPCRRKRSTPCSRSCAASGVSHEPKASTRRGTGMSVTSNGDPSISGSPEGPSQATNSCCSLDRNTSARSRCRRVCSSFEANSASRRRQAFRSAI